MGNRESGGRAMGLGLEQAILFHLSGGLIYPMLFTFLLSLHCICLDTAVYDVDDTPLILRNL